MASSRHSHRWLILLAVTSAMAIVTSAGAQVRRPAAGTTVRSSPAYRHVAFAPAPSAESRRPSPRDHGAYSQEIAEAAARYAVPERLIWAVIRVQLMPETAAMLGVRDSFDPRENINGGTRHLRAMMIRFRYDLRLAVAAYNAGERPVAAYGGVPPYRETREYVTQVLRFYDAPVEWRRLPGTDIHRIVEPNGTIVYTNIPVGQLSALARGR